jgi:hypothetical protein
MTSFQLSFRCALSDLTGICSLQGSALFLECWGPRHHRARHSSPEEWKGTSRLQAAVRYFERRIQIY